MLKNNLSARRIGYIKSYCRDLQRNPEISSTPTYIRTLSPEDQIKAKEQGRENRRSFIEKNALKDYTLHPITAVGYDLSFLAGVTGLTYIGALGGTELITQGVYYGTNRVLTGLEKLHIAMLISVPFIYKIATKWNPLIKKDVRKEVANIASNSISLEETGKPASSLEKTVSY